MLQAAIHQKALCGQRRRWSKLGGGRNGMKLQFFNGQLQIPTEKMWVLKSSKC